MYLDWIFLVLLIISAYGSIFIVYSHYFHKPKIIVYFPNGTTKLDCRVNEERTICFYFQNLRKTPATNIMCWLYVPKNFEIRGRPTKNAPPDGIFRDLKYVMIIRPELSFTLIHKEVEDYCVNFKLPSEPALHDIKISIKSDEGDLGVHTLTINVEK